MIIEVEIMPKFPDKADSDRRLQIVDAMAKMIKEGKVSVGRMDALIDVHLTGYIIHVKATLPANAYVHFS